jgi:hypothetical protein
VDRIVMAPLGESGPECEPEPRRGHPALEKRRSTDVPANGSEPTSGRETRLLVLVVVVSLAVLLLLARFQFPEANLASVNPSPGPLAGMAARATFEEMSATLAGVLARAAPAVDVIRIEPVPADQASGGARGAARGVAAGSGASPAVPATTPGAAGPRFAAAVRVRADLALLHVPNGWRPAALRDQAGPIDVVLTDADREIAVVRVPVPAAGPPVLPGSVVGVTGFLYVAAIQGTRSGPTIQPAFVGRAETETDARWSAPLVVLSGNPSVPVGSLVFAIDGRLIGLAGRHDAGVAIVPASALDDAVARLVPGGAPNE